MLFCICGFGWLFPKPRQLFFHHLRIGRLYGQRGSQAPHWMQAPALVCRVAYRSRPPLLQAVPVYTPETEKDAGGSRYHRAGGTVAAAAELGAQRIADGLAGGLLHWRYAGQGWPAPALLLSTPPPLPCPGWQIVNTGLDSTYRKAPDGRPQRNPPASGFMSMNALPAAAQRSMSACPAAPRCCRGT